MTIKTVTVRVSPQFDQLYEVWITGAGAGTLGGMHTEYVCQTAAMVDELIAKVKAAVEKTNSWCISAPFLEGYQLTTKAGRVGFNWPDAASVLRKLEEEIAELREAAEADP